MCSNPAAYFSLAINNINFYKLVEFALDRVPFVMLLISLAVKSPHFCEASSQDFRILVPYYITLLIKRTA
jgi:hypothetical protein